MDEFHKEEEHLAVRPDPLTEFSLLEKWCALIFHTVPAGASMRA